MADALTSSSAGVKRPSKAALALAERIRYCEARGPAPQATHCLISFKASSVLGRDFLTKFTANLRT